MSTLHERENEHHHFSCVTQLEMNGAEQQKMITLFQEYFEKASETFLHGTFFEKALFRFIFNAGVLSVTKADIPTCSIWLESVCKPT